MPLLEIRNLQIEFGRGAKALRAVDGVSLSLDAGKTLGLVGESGSGKSVTALSIARLLASPPAVYAGGEILLEGRDVLRMRGPELREIRGGLVSYVFQEPGASLNPVFRVGNQIKEALRLHRPKNANEAEVVRLLKLVGIPAPEKRLKSYPHELSGGMQQRVMIAMALAPHPRLLVADEPTTALDVTIQAQIIELLAQLRQQLGMAIFIITHNLGILGDIADEVAVMYAGQIVERSPAHELLRRPLHPYTRALMASVPKLGGAIGPGNAGDAFHSEAKGPAREDARPTGRLPSIPGSVPRLGSFPSGCRFHPRCSMAKPECSQAMPELIEAERGRFVRCPLWNSPVQKA